MNATTWLDLSQSERRAVPFDQRPDPQEIETLAQFRVFEQHYNRLPRWKRALVDLYGWLLLHTGGRR